MVLAPPLGFFGVTTRITLDRKSGLARPLYLSTGYLENHYKG